MSRRVEVRHHAGDRVEDQLDLELGQAGTGAVVRAHAAEARQPRLSRPLCCTQNDHSRMPWPAIASHKKNVPNGGFAQLSMLS